MGLHVQYATVWAGWALLWECILYTEHSSLTTASITIYPYYSIHIPLTFPVIWPQWFHPHACLSSWNIRPVKAVWRLHLDILNSCGFFVLSSSHTHTPVFLLYNTIHLFEHLTNLYASARGTLSWYNLWRPHPGILYTCRASLQYGHACDVAG